MIAIFSDFFNFEINPEMRDVLAKMRECGKYAKMRDFPHDCGTVDTYVILHCYSFSHEFNKLSLATCVVTIFITPSPWKCIPLPWLYRLYYRLWVSRRIYTWQIVYLSNKDPCPKISIHKSEIKVGLPWSHGQRWKFTSFSIHKVARPSGTNLQLAAVHERPWWH